MKYYFPCARKWNHWVIAIDNFSLHLIKLNSMTIFKYELNVQAGIYRNFMKKLKQKKINEFIKEHESFQLFYKDDLKIKLIKNKFWGDYLIINHFEKKYKFQLHYKIMKSDFYIELRNKLGNNFIE